MITTRPNPPYRVPELTSISYAEETRLDKIADLFNRGTRSTRVDGQWNYNGALGMDFGRLRDIDHMGHVAISMRSNHEVIAWHLAGNVHVSWSLCYLSNQICEHYVGERPFTMEPLSMTSATRSNRWHINGYELHYQGEPVSGREITIVTSLAAMAVDAETRARV